MSYGWMIDKDHYGEGPEGTNQNAVGIMGPRDMTDAIVTRLKAGEGQSFRMGDDDNDLYYEGRFFDEDYDTQDLRHLPLSRVDVTEAAFAPLDDFGRPNAGCTSIQYKNESGEWETI